MRSECQIKLSRWTALQDDHLLLRCTVVLQATRFILLGEAIAASEGIPTEKTFLI